KEAPTECKALPDLSHAIPSIVFVLDIAWNLTCVAANISQHRVDGSVAFSKRNVGPLVLLAVLDMRAHDPIPVLAQVLERIKPGSDEMPNVQRDHYVVGPAAKRRGKIVRRGHFLRPDCRVIVQPDLHLVSLRRRGA